MLPITRGGGGGGGRFWEEGVDSGGVHNLHQGYTLESTPAFPGIIWGLTPGQKRDRAPHRMQGG